MKNIIEKIKTKRYIHYIIIFIIGALVCIPFLWVQIYNSDDGAYHFLRLVGLNYAMDYSSFPFLVFPFFCNNWGYSMTVFYPQFVTYIPYLFGIISGSFMNGLKFYAMFATILSGIFMYNFVNEVTKKKSIAIISAILYLTFPYRFECLFNRYAIGEFSAFIFIPIVFQGLYNLINGDKKKHFYIAIGATGLILTHSISTVYTALFCIIYILFNLKLFFKKDIIKKCLINVIFILLMSSMFIIPLLEFRNSADYTILEPILMRSNAKNVATKTIEPWQFLKNKNEENPVSFILGIPFITMFFIGILVYKKIDKKYKDFYITNITLGIISLIMCTNLFPWIIMPDILCILQYPWRLLGFAYFFLVPVCAINVYFLIKLIKKQWVKNIIYTLFIIILGIFTFIELSQYPTENTSKDEKYEKLVYEQQQIHYFTIIRDNMPVKAVLEQNKSLKTRDDSTYIISGNVNIVKEKKEALHLELEIKNGTKDTELELPYLFYPGYTVKLEYNNNVTKLSTLESERGFIKITLPEDIETGKITVDYTATLLEKAAYIISLISLIIFIIYVIYYVVCVIYYIV